jgi:hypothetical protein
MPTKDELEAYVKKLALADGDILIVDARYLRPEDFVHLPNIPNVWLIPAAPPTGQTIDDITRQLNASDLEHMLQFVKGRMKQEAQKSAEAGLVSNA